MTRPAIGITMDTGDKPADYHLYFDYVDAVQAAGGLPLPLPYRADPSLIGQYLDLVDGLLLTGGDDLDPSSYGQSWHPQAHRIDPDRQRFELALLAELEQRPGPLPVLGICLGCQVMNVHRGGSLWQFLPEEPAPQLEHRRRPGAELHRHPVTLAPDCRLSAAIGRGEISVNTYHKQAVREVGRRLRVVGTSPDGIIEAIEDPARPLFVGVQWHPERLYREPEHLAVFRMLVAACGDRGQTTEARRHGGGRELD